MKFLLYRNEKHCSVTLVDVKYINANSKHPSLIIEIDLFEATEWKNSSVFRKNLSSIPRFLQRNIDVQETAGHSENCFYKFEFRGSVALFYALNIIQEGLINEGEFHFDSKKNQHESDYILAFEQMRLEAWQRACEAAQTELKNCMEVQHTRIASDKNNYDNITAIINNYQQFIKQYDDPAAALTFFLTTYLQYRTKASVNALFRQLINSQLFALKDIQNFLQTPSILPGDGKKLYGQILFNLDPFFYCTLPKFFPAQEHQLWDVLRDWVAREYGKVSHHAAPSHGPVLFIHTMKNKSLFKKANSAKSLGEAITLLQQLAMKRFAPACYQLAIIFYKQFQGNPNQKLLLETAAEWVYRGTLIDNGSGLKDLFKVKGQFKKSFIKECCFLSPQITLQVLSNPMHFLKNYASIEKNLYIMILKTPWTNDTAVKGVCQLANLMENGYKTAIQDDMLCQAFSKYPKACLSILSNSVLMQCISPKKSPQYLGSLLLACADELVQSIRSEEVSQTQADELRNFIWYAEQFELIDIQQNCFNPLALKTKYGQIIVAVEERATGSPYYAELLQALMRTSTHFNKHYLMLKNEMKSGGAGQKEVKSIVFSDADTSSFYSQSQPQARPIASSSSEPARSADSPRSAN